MHQPTCDPIEPEHLWLGEDYLPLMPDPLHPHKQHLVD